MRATRTILIKAVQNLLGGAGAVLASARSSSGVRAPTDTRAYADMAASPRLITLAACARLISAASSCPS